MAAKKRTPKVKKGRSMVAGIVAGPSSKRPPKAKRRKGGY